MVAWHEGKYYFLTNKTNKMKWIKAYIGLEDLHLKGGEKCLVITTNGSYDFGEFNGEINEWFLDHSKGVKITHFARLSKPRS